MFEISELKGKKLPELQELAKTLGVPKYRSLKKLDLVYKILDHQAANPTAIKAVVKDEPAKESETKPVTEQPKKDNRNQNQRKDDRNKKVHPKSNQSRNHPKEI